MKENKETIVVSLNKIIDIYKFVRLVSKCSNDVIVKTERYSVNAKSIMGLFSLDLSRALEVEFYGKIPIEVKAGIRKFIVD